MAIDPMCGMEVNEASALKAQRDGRTYHFSSEQPLRCFRRGDKLFDADGGPGLHLAQRANRFLLAVIGIETRGT
jgi:YHS domain-containing protein